MESIQTKKSWLKYSMTLYTVALMCIFFVIVGAHDALAHFGKMDNGKLVNVNAHFKGADLMKNVMASVDYLNLFGIMTAAFFGLAMFENHGKLTGFWGGVSAAITVVVFWKLKIWTLFALYVYNVVTNIILVIQGGNEEKTPNIKSTIIELSLVLIVGLGLQIYFAPGHKLGFSVIEIFGLISFLLTGVGQLLLIKQTRWQFAAWVPKNGFELVVGLMTGDPVVICRNVFFMGMNVFSLSNWLLTAKENELKKEEEKSKEETKNDSVEESKVDSEEK